MSRTILFAPILACLIAVAACATGAEDSGDPNATSSGTDPEGTSADDAGPGTDAKSSSSSNNNNNNNNASGDAGNKSSGTDSGSSNTSKDSGSNNNTSSCPGYADPNTNADCVDTQYCGGSKPACNANGCDTTYWCDLSSKKCVKKPSSC